MARDMLRVDGVPPDTRMQLQESANKLYGKPNASLLVRALIASHLNKPAVDHARPKPVDFSGETIRVELRLPQATVEQLDRLAEAHFSPRNYYINTLIFSHLGQPQLYVDEIEVLRSSNYEMARIGTNLNQIAKAFNVLVKLRGDGKVPEIGKKMASLRRDISEHTNRVLRVLDAKTALWEAKVRGQKSTKRK